MLVLRRPGSLNYVFETDVLEGIANMGNVVGFDLVEVAPQYDPTGITPRLSAMTMLTFMGFIMKEREMKGLLKTPASLIGITPPYRRAEIL